MSLSSSGFLFWPVSWALPSEARAEDTALAKGLRSHLAARSRCLQQDRSTAIIACCLRKAPPASALYPDNVL